MNRDTEEKKSARAQGKASGAKPGLSTLRRVLPWIVMVVVALGFGLHKGFGTLSDFGWMDVSVLCPLGALGTMLASKLLVPRALISLAIVAVLILLLGRTFCGWVCPVPSVAKLRRAFAKGGRTKKDAEEAAARTPKLAPGAPLTDEEKALLAQSCHEAHSSHGTRVFDSRGAVLAGALGSAAIFGFPVFCLVCPIGLTFATILLVMRAFGVGDVTVSLIVVPALLLAEVVFFRKWCHTLCPLGALMSLLGRANRTVLPTIDNEKCLETSKGRRCGACGRACDEGIDPRHPQLGAARANECTRCRACADACPAGAITFPLIARTQDEGPAPAIAVKEEAKALPHSQ